MIHQYDCIIKTRIPNKSYLKGPVVDLKLIGFYEENPQDHLPYYWYEILSGGKPVGKISLRLGFNESSIVNGQVGYEIDEDFRGHNYSYYALEVIKSLAMDHGFRYLLVTTSTENMASQKIIRKAKGKLIMSDYLVPLDHIFHVLGKPKINIYEIKLGS